MPVKIRLQRHGKKGRPFYHIVVADSRASRDGKFIEKLGTYNPITQPATIDLNVDSACKWLKNGAQPTDTARAILSYKGALIKRHLQIGVEKGAITQETADAKFNAWLTEKESKISAAQEAKRNGKKDAAKKALAAELEINAKRVEAIAAKKAAAEAAEKAESATEETPAQEQEVATEEETPAAE